MAEHRLDPVSLAAGLLSVALGVLWFVGDQDHYLDRVVWICPSLLLVVGVALVAGAKDRR